MRASTSARVQKHRAALRESGLRPVQIWVPDTRRAGFAEGLLQDRSPEPAPPAHRGDKVADIVTRRGRDKVDEAR